MAEKSAAVQPEQNLLESHPLEKWREIPMGRCLTARREHTPDPGSGAFSPVSL